MSRTRTEPTVPTDQEALLAREASKALEAHDAAGKGVRVQVAEAGRARSPRSIFRLRRRDCCSRC